ncbi:MAG: Kdo hydroxylase family protein, partial [Pseudomonadota bacterium]
MIVWARHHRQALAAAIASLLRTPLASLMTVAVIGITLALPTGLHVVLDNLSHLTGGWTREAGEISVFLKPGTSTASAEKLAERLRRESDIAAVQHVTPDQALREFRARPGFGESLKALDTNPLPHLLVVRPVTSLSAESLDPLRQRLAKESAVDQAVLALAWVQRLQNWLELAGRFAAMLALLLALGVLLIVSNTIRLAVANRRDEIAVTKLVGGKSADHSAYDLFMLHFHDWLKANEAYQQSEHERHAFPPNACWMVLTDGVPHTLEEVGREFDV